MDAFVLSSLAYCCAWLFVRLIQYVDEGNCHTNAMNRFMKNGTRKMSIHLAHDFTWAQLSADIWWVQQCQGTLTWIKLTIVLYLASSSLRRHRRKPRSCGLEMRWLYIVCGCMTVPVGFGTFFSRLHCHINTRTSFSRRISSDWRYIEWKK